MTRVEAIERLETRRRCAVYVDSEYVDSVDIEAINIAIEALKEEHEIGYRECSDALLKMWMDKVLTDRQYSNIMGKLCLYWEHRKQEGER